MLERRKQKDIDELACGLAMVLLAEWIAIEHGETRLQANKYMEEAEGLQAYLAVIGYRLCHLFTECLPPKEV